MDSQRLLSRTDESTFSITPSLAEDAGMASKLLEELSICEEPKDLLRKMLSINSQISTTSSFARRMQQAELDEDLRFFRQIGIGSCGVVFEQTGCAHVVKRELDGDIPLWPDFVMHKVVQEGLEKYDFTGIRVPRCIGYINAQNEKWWADNRNYFPEKYEAAANLLLSERILPLPRIVRDNLVDLYLPESLQAKKESVKADPANKDCLARLYLGRRRDTSRRPSLLFTLRNFILHVDQMEELQLDVSLFASTMASTLAVLHWGVNVDGDDIEFVLGSAPTTVFHQVPDSEELKKLPANTDTMGARLGTNSHLRSIFMWVLDFNQCHELSMDENGVKQAVKAFLKNDPYYPRPLADNSRDQQLWKTFQERYIHASELILGKDGTALPLLFIELLVKEMQSRLEARRV